MQKKLQGKVALVTGGTAGIGLATAKRFVAEGARVYITGRRQATLDKAVKEIGDNVIGVQGDVASLQDLDRLFATIKAQSGHLDILFANAGGGAFVPIDQVTEAHYEKIFNTNVKGLLFTVQKALSLLKDGSSIVLNASIVTNKGMENFSVYSASKAAVRSFARSWTNDLRARKIRVNAVSPGVTKTDIFESSGLSEAQAEEFLAAKTKEIPLGRYGVPDDIAKAVLFLASDDSSFISGIELAVDGGMVQI